MSRLLRHPERLWVRENDRGEPLFLCHAGKLQPVRTIQARWRVDVGWWGKAVVREYFRVETPELVCEVYRDLQNGGWYLQRLYD